MLNDVVRNSESKKFFLEFVHVVQRKQRGVKRGANFIRKAAGKENLQTGECFLPAVFNAGDARVVGEGSLDIETNPIKTRQQSRESLGEDTGRVQADAETKGADFLDRFHERRLQRGLAAGEDDSIKQAAPASKKREHIGPCNLALILNRA